MLEKLGHHVEAAAPTFHPEALGAAMQYLMSAPMAVEIDQRLAELGRELRDDDLETMARVSTTGASRNPSPIWRRAMRHSSSPGGRSAGISPSTTCC